MEKVRIEAQLPAVLAEQARTFVADGCAKDLDELLAEALRRFLESHAPELTDAFMKEDVRWGLRGNDRHGRRRASPEPEANMATHTDERVHIERTGAVAMDLPSAEAFPLFSAEGERRWVAGWDPCYVHPNEPGAGEGVIFRTTNKGVGTATWIQTRHDPAAGVASCVYMVPDHHAAMVDVQVIPEGEARSRATVKYRMTSLSSAADDFVRAFGEAFDDYLGDWAEAIRRHIVEGVSLRQNHRPRLTPHR